MKYRPQLNTAAHNKQHIRSPTNRTFQGKVLTVHLHLQQSAKGAASTAAVTHPWALAAFVHLHGMRLLHTLKLKGLRRSHNLRTASCTLRWQIPEPATCCDAAAYATIQANSCHALGSDLLIHNCAQQATQLRSYQYKLHTVKLSTPLMPRCTAKPPAFNRHGHALGAQHCTSTLRHSRTSGYRSQRPHKHSQQNFCTFEGQAGSTADV